MKQVLKCIAISVSKGLGMDEGAAIPGKFLAYNNQTLFG